MAAMPPAGYMAALGAAAKPPPPQMPPGPPPPTGAGAMSVGDADSKSDPRTSASAAIMALRDLKMHFPQMAPAIDGFTAQIQAAAKGQGGAGGAAGDKPAVPGADLASLIGGMGGGDSAPPSDGMDDM